MTGFSAKQSEPLTNECVLLLPQGYFKTLTLPWAQEVPKKRLRNNARKKKKQQGAIEAGLTNLTEFIFYSISGCDTTVKHDRNLQVQSVQDEDLVTSLLEDVETEIFKTLQRDKVLQTKGASSLSEEDQSMIPRLAQLEDKLEKRDKIILKLKKENVALKEALKEVKERNQSLCTIMSQGEFSEKADLVKQVNDLSVLKDDLTLEIESLNVALEQEKSKNKVLTKYQTSQSKITKQSIH